MKNVITLAQTNVSIFRQKVDVKALLSETLYTKKVYISLQVSANMFMTQYVTVHVEWKNRDIFSLWEYESKEYLGLHFPDFFIDVLGEDALVFYTR